MTSLNPIPPAAGTATGTTAAAPIPAAQPPARPGTTSAPEGIKEKVKRLRVEVEAGNQTSLLFLLDEIIKKLGL